MVYGCISSIFVKMELAILRRRKNLNIEDAGKKLDRFVLFSRHGGSVGLRSPRSSPPGARSLSASFSFFDINQQMRTRAASPELFLTRALPSCRSKI